MARSESCRPSVVGVGNDAEDRENRKDSVDQIQQPGLDALDRDRNTEARADSLGTAAMKSMPATAGTGNVTREEHSGRMVTGTTAKA